MTCEEKNKLYITTRQVKRVMCVTIENGKTCNPVRELLRTNNTCVCGLVGAGGGNAQQRSAGSSAIQVVVDVLFVTVTSG